MQCAFPSTSFGANVRPLKHNRTTALAAIALAGAFALGVTGCSTTDADADPSASNTATESEDASEAALAVDVNQSGSQVLSENQEIHSVEQVDEAASVDVDLSASQFWMTLRSPQPRGRRSQLLKLMNSPLCWQLTQQTL